MRTALVIGALLPALLASTPGSVQTLRRPENLSACPVNFGITPPGRPFLLCSCGAVSGEEVVQGGRLFSPTAPPCQAGRRAGTVPPAGGILVARVLPAPGDSPGQQGTVWRVLRPTPGNLDWALRQNEVAALPNRPIVVPDPSTGKAMELAPEPMPQAADFEDLVGGTSIRDRPTLANLSPPVLPPALWRTPVRTALHPPPTTQPQGETRARPLPTPAPGSPVLSLAAGAIIGPAEIITTSRLRVSGRTVDLAFIEGLSGGPAQGLARYLAARGGEIRCEPAGAQGFRCLAADGSDLAQAALLNGSARTRSDAPEHYRAAEIAAQSAKRGVWADNRR
jgi:hypothetical protein